MCAYMPSYILVFTYSYIPYKVCIHLHTLYTPIYIYTIYSYIPNIPVLCYANVGSGQDYTNSSILTNP